MKKSLFLLAAAVALALVGVFQATRPVDATPSSAEEWHQRFDLKVLKVFSVQDGDAVFRAYAVDWKGQEVIASDTLVMTDYKVGDTVSVLAMKHDFPNGQAGPGLLHFEVVRPSR